MVALSFVREFERVRLCVCVCVCEIELSLWPQQIPKCIPSLPLQWVHWQLVPLLAQALTLLGQPA